jgi:uncharacterized protein YeaO (DUF488 family)
VKLKLAIKRAYEPPAGTDGYRVLVDRLWPRGVKREALAIGEWAKDIAPSTALRRAFHHDPERWDDFVEAYRAELSTKEAQLALARLRKMARTRKVTLVYAAREDTCNNAAALRLILEAKPQR